ncbi:MAG: TM2 domain-containing membrane protein YozV [Parvicellaceae bacterium]|jgi:TM2 domain-containing membrane protein YozV
MRFVFLFGLFLINASLLAQSDASRTSCSKQFQSSEINLSVENSENKPAPKTKRAKKKKRKRTRFRRGVAALLALFLGPFGVHRLYLGTGDFVPIFYTLTLGGLMILPLVDMFVMLFSKKFDQYIGNKSVIMW